MDSITDSTTDSQGVTPAEFAYINALPIVEGYSARQSKPNDQAQQAPTEDHEDEDEMRLRLEEWRSLLSNLSGGFTQVPDAVRNDPTLSSSAKLVYEHLLSYMRQKDWCWPGQKRIAAELGISRRTVIRACNELYGRCYIERWRRGLGKTNIYFVNPLSFVQSFRQPGRGKPDPKQGAKGLLQANGPEHQQTLSWTSPQVYDWKNQAFYPYHNDQMCQKDTSRSDKMAHSEAPNWHTKHTKKEENKEEKDISSNYSTQNLKGTGTTPKTIRRVEQSTLSNEKVTKGTELSNTITQSKTNTNVISIENSAPDRAKGVEKTRGAGRPSAQAQAIADQTGISTTHLDELGVGRPEGKRSTPRFLANTIESLSRQLGDAERFIKSNVTRATKIHYMLYDLCDGYADDPQDNFLRLVDTARDACYQVQGIQHRNGGRFNRVPVFFTCLENKLNLTPEEAEILRSERPLLQREDRYDYVD